jgi:hypothetical protein
MPNRHTVAYPILQVRLAATEPGKSRAKTSLASSRAAILCFFRPISEAPRKPPLLGTTRRLLGGSGLMPRDGSLALLDVRPDAPD